MEINLVTGAAGFIGSHLANYLHSQGLYVRATDLPGSNTSSLNKKIEFIPADLCSKKSLESIMQGVTRVFHVAAIFNFSASEELLNRVNVTGTENLCKVALRNKVKKIVNVSSYAVYGDYGIKTEQPLTEKTAKNPSSPYGKSKFLQDEIIIKYGKKGLDYTIVRPSVPYGKGNTYGAFQMLKLISLLPVTPIPKNLETRVGFIHVDDVVAAMLHVASLPDSSGQEFNLTDSSNYTTPEFLEILASLFDKMKVPVHLPVVISPLLVGTATIVEKLWLKFLKSRPFISRDATSYLFMDFPFSNKKLLSTGYKFKYPYPKEGMADTIAHNRLIGAL